MLLLFSRTNSYFTELIIFSFKFFEIGFLINWFSLTFSFIVLLIGLVVSVYSIEYFKNDVNQTRFWFWFGFFISSMLLLTFSNNLLLSFISWEFTGICSWALISYYYDSNEKPTDSKFGSLGEQSIFFSYGSTIVNFYF